MLIWTKIQGRINNTITNGEISGDNNKVLKDNISACDNVEISIINQEITMFPHHLPLHGTR